MMNSTALQSTTLLATDALREAVLALQAAHVETASLDARVLLQHVLDVSREQLLADETLVLTPQQERHYRTLIEKRRQRQPVSQLTGKREFWGLCFHVTEATLDPRPDSETLVEAVLERCKDRSAPLRVLDMGTGTGCLLLSLLAEYPNAAGVGIDLSEKALGVAQENAIRLGMQARARFMRSDWAQEVKGVFDVILSNPPYIPTGTIPALAPEVSRFEPRLALDGGEDGLDCYRTILAALPELLAKNGIAVLEVGMGQDKPLKALAAEHRLALLNIKEDLAGIARCVIVQSIDQ